MWHDSTVHPGHLPPISSFLPEYSVWITFYEKGERERRRYRFLNMKRERMCKGRKEKIANTKIILRNFGGKLLQVWSSILFICWAQTWNQILHMYSMLWNVAWFITYNIFPWTFCRIVASHEIQNFLIKRVLKQIMYFLPFHETVVKAQKSLHTSHSHTCANVCLPRKEKKTHHSSS